LVYERIPIRNTGFCIRCRVKCRFSGCLDELARVYAEFVGKYRLNIRQRPTWLADVMVTPKEKL
jgi:hypothetical protein